MASSPPTRTRKPTPAPRRDKGEERLKRISQIDESANPRLRVLEPGTQRWITSLIRMTSPHPMMTRVLDVIDRLQQRPYRTNVLLQGPPGTGKDGLARALAETMVPGAPVIRLDVAGMSDDEALAALCGERKNPGAAEQAEGGILLIEEIAALPMRAQSELLRLLKAGKIQRVDTAHPGKNRFTVNAIAITDRNLKAEVDAGRFRHDLYYRLARIVLSLPPLADRVDDVGPSAVWMGNRILRDAGVQLVLRGSEDYAQASDEEQAESIELTDEALEFLKLQPWPGNFRQLEAVLERALLLYRDDKELNREAVEAALDVPRPKRAPPKTRR